MKCNDLKVTQGYVASDDPEQINLGCMPSGNGEPTTAPNPDQIPFYFDMTNEALYYYTCDPDMWVKVDSTIADLNPVDISNLADPAENLQIPVVYEVGGVKVEGLVTLQELIEIIESENVSVTDVSVNDEGKLVVTKSDGLITETQLEFIKSITTNEDGNLVITNADGTESIISLSEIASCGGFFDCEGEPICHGASLATCRDLEDAIENVFDGFKDWFDNEATEQDKADIINSLLGELTDCNDEALNMSKSLATCENLDEVIQQLENLNQGINLPSDATDCSRAVSICGVTNILNDESGDNPIQQAIKNLIGEQLGSDQVFQETVIENLVSDDPGNLLESRDDGLYYGIEAAPELTNLYVDAENGNDSLDPINGGGTEANPFKTLNRALSVTPIDKSNTIHLKSAGSSGQPLIYDLDRNVRVEEGAVRNIRSYGPQPNIPQSIADCISSQTFYWYPQNATEYVRPIINIKWYTFTLNPNLRSTVYAFFGPGTYNFSAVELRVETSPYTVELYVPFIFRTLNVVVDSSIIKFNGVDDAKLLFVYQGGVSQLSLTRTKIENLPENAIDLYIGTASISSTNGQLFADPTIANSCGATGVLTTLEHTATTELQKPNVFRGVVRGNSGDPLNVTANFTL